MKKWIVSAVLYLLIVIAAYAIWASFNESPKNEHQNHQSISYPTPIEKSYNIRVR
ncbi:hypothetical protein ACMYUM_27950 (plasmid) [Priestia megaterium]|uniref:hypothetical protein n=1 Tax=Priestia TaxID=2800373 RepID=UPI00196A7D03|nr:MULTISPECIES: hypothetical protein [Priestia]MCW1048988.1 hypothetical protein [Priestia sp. JV24]QSF42086.1 hypothetical protein ICR96_29450 [Priestia megaterium]